MKLLIIGLLASSAMTGAAYAGNDWSGFYAGATVSFDGGNFDYYNSALEPEMLIFSSGISGTTYGAFAGYNFQAGALVFGAELAYLGGEVRGTQIGISSPFHMDWFLDIKARAGYTVAPDLLVYAVLGGSFSQMQDDDFPGIYGDLSGMNYGAGAEYKFGGNMVAGLEYLVRNLDGTIPGGARRDDVQTQSVQLRLGWQF